MRISKKLQRWGYTYTFMPKSSEVEFFATKGQPTKIVGPGEFDFNDDDEFDVFKLEGKEQYDLEKGKMHKLCS